MANDTTETIMCICELRWNNGALEQKLVIQPRGQTELIEEWRVVPGVAVAASIAACAEPKKRRGPIPKRQIDWSQVDWRKKNFLLVVELGVSQQTLSAKRRLYGFKADYGHCKAAIRNANYDAFDWTKSNFQLAVDHGVNAGVVAEQRALRGIPNAVQRRVKARSDVNKSRIDSADWLHKQDIILAKEWGISRERVRQIRLENHKPACEHRWKRTAPNAKHQKVIDWLLAHRPEIEGKFAGIVAREMIPKDVTNLCVSSRLAIMRKSGIQFNFGRFYRRDNTTWQCRNQDDMNWSLGDKMLAIIWNRCDATISNIRSRFSKPSCKWSFRLEHRNTTVQDPAFYAAVEAEIDNAIKHGIAVDRKSVYAFIEDRKTTRRERITRKLPFDWRLPNAALGMIWGTCPSYVSEYRFRHSRPEPTWRLVGSSKAVFQDDAFREAIAGEIAKAKTGHAVDNERATWIWFERRRQKQHYRVKSDAVAA